MQIQTYTLLGVYFFQSGKCPGRWGGVHPKTQKNRGKYWWYCWWLKSIEILQFIPSFTGFYTSQVLIEIHIPSWELTYPIEAVTFESMICRTSQGGISDRSLEGTTNACFKRFAFLFLGWRFGWLSLMNGPGLLPLDLSFVQPNFVGKGYHQKIIPKTHLSGLSGVFANISHQSSPKKSGICSIHKNNLSLWKPSDVHIAW